MTDQEILDIIRQRGQVDKGFRLLVEAFQERLYWHIRRMVIDHEEANDLLQETFIKAYRNIGNFEGKSALYTWVYRIATNECLTHLQRKKKHNNTSLDASDTIGRQLEADEWFDGDEAQLILQEAIATLPDKQRLVFNMRYYDEMNYQDMSDALDTSVGALKASYHHAVKKIETFVKSYKV